MQKYTVRKYLPTDAAEWNEFIGKAKNATFLFDRNYMDYHSDRFDDYSLMVFDNRKLVAVMPANRVGDVIHSHQGLTYGGIVIGQKVKLSHTIVMLCDILRHLSEAGFTTLKLKLIPSIYCDTLSDETSYALFAGGATLERRDNLSVVDQSMPIAISKDRIKCALRAERHNLTIREEPYFDDFWNTVLIPNMRQKHGVQPVHSLAEITKLQQLFPHNIRHFNVYHNQTVIAGTTIYVSSHVAHPQYISANSQKNDTGSLDYLYSYLIREVFQHKKYFDFGPSTEQNGTKINSGILFWKESFGTSTASQDFYSIKTENFKLLQNVML